MPYVTGEHGAGRLIGPILQVRFNPSVVPIYQCHPAGG
jgi:hypothetical protein